jgi:hypothetical protein
MFFHVFNHSGLWYDGRHLFKQNNIFDLTFMVLLVSSKNLCLFLVFMKSLFNLFSFKVLSYKTLLWPI